MKNFADYLDTVDLINADFPNARLYHKTADGATPLTEYQLRTILAAGNGYILSHRGCFEYPVIVENIAGVFWIVCPDGMMFRSSTANN